MSLDFIASIRFFSPSKRLTGQLLDSIEELEQRDLTEMETDPDQMISDEETHTLSASEAHAWKEEPADEPRLSGEEVMDLFQKRIAEELYYHLAFLASTTEDLRTPCTRESIAQGMSMALGLPERDPLLFALADEFSDWMRHEAEFVTGWGTIICADEEGVFLTYSATIEDESDTPASSFVVPYSAGHRRRPKVVDRAKSATEG